MRLDPQLDGGRLVQEAHNCCDRIAKILEDAIHRTEQLGDRDTLAQLIAAKAAADHGTELINRLGDLLHSVQPTNTTGSS